MAYVYRHIRLDKYEPFYIGIGGLGTFDDYRRAHFRYRKNSIWNKIIRKTPYKVEILLDNLSKEEALAKETEFIKLYGRRDIKTGPLCNLTDGGEGGINKSITEETRERMSRATKGINNPFYGRKHSRESMINHGSIVLNLETGIFYDSMREAYLLTQYKYKTFKAMLNGQNRNKTSFVQV
jgi:hypothetical protein